MIRGIFVPRCLLAVVVVSLYFALGAGAQETPALGAFVELAGSKITLRVTEPTELRAVLEVLCQRTQTRCDLAPELAQCKMEPTTISGTWKEVVAQLLEGESVNFANLGSGPSGRLVVQARRAAPPTSPAKTDEREGKVAQQRRDSESADGRDPEERERSEREQPASSPAPPSSLSDEMDRSEFRGAGGVAGKERDSAQSGGPPTMSSQEQQAREAAVWGIITGRTPIPSAPSAPPGMVMLPVPDLNGNPILAPTTGTGLTAAPFPGPNGQPIYITPGAPTAITNPFGVPPQPRP